MTLKNIIEERWKLPPPAEHIQAIIEHLKLPVTAKVMEQVARFAAWDALQAAYEADLGEGLTETRSYLLP